MGVAGKNQGIFRNDAINVMDSRGLTVSIELTVQYRLNPQTTPPNDRYLWLVLGAKNHQPCGARCGALCRGALSG